MLGYALKLPDDTYLRIKREKAMAKRVPTMNIGNYKFIMKSDSQDNIIQNFSINYFQQRDKELSDGIEHPTMKPIKLLNTLIINSSKEKDIILDCFGGSGSTLIAAEQTQRKARLIELDPIYVSRTIERWENQTGKKAVKL
jgi:DNA modification methylase